MTVPRSRRRRLIVQSVWFLLGFSLTVSLRGADPWDGAPFTADPEQVRKAVAALPVPEDADIETLLEEDEFRFRPDGSHQLRRRHWYRVLTASGVDERSELAVEWSPWHEAKPTIEARVISVDGRAHRLQAAEVLEAPVDQQPLVYSDRRQLRAPLPAVAVGAIVETLVVIDETQPYFAAGQVWSHFFNRFEPARRVRLVVDVPMSLPIQTGKHGSAIQEEVNEAEGRKRWTWTVAPAPGFHDYELDVPSTIVQGTRVLFSTASSWSQVAAAYSKLVENQLRDDPSAELAKAHAGQAADRRHRIQKLLQALHEQIRYTGLAFGESSIVPAAPRETLRRRYGDCKDQATLLVGWLRAAGIEADVALLLASHGADIHPDFPGLGMFNHAIVHVRGEPGLWIDPTDRFLPLGELPSSVQDRWALIAREGQERLVRTPRMRSEENGYTETREYFLDEFKGCRLTEVASQRGQFARNSREQIISSGDREWRQMMRNYAKETYLAEKVTQLSWSDPRDLQVPMEVRLETADCGRAVVAVRDLSVHLFPAPIFAQLPSPLRDFRPYAPDPDPNDPSPQQPFWRRFEDTSQRRRQHPLVNDHPHRIEQICKIHLPAGFVPQNLPQDERVQIGPAVLEQLFRLENPRLITATFRFDSGNGDFTPQQIAEWQQALKKYCRDDDLGQWMVTISAVHAGYEHEQQGRWRDALTIYRQEVEQDAGNLAAYVRLTEAYHDSGFVLAAQKTARKLVELAPELAIAHGNLGYAHSRADAVFEHPTGETRELAIAALKKAIELDPDNVQFRLNLAVLLEYDANGQRYPIPGTEASVEELLKVKDQLPPLYQSNLLLSLLQLERYAELQQHLNAFGITPQTEGLMMAAVAMQEGLPAAATYARQNLPAERQQFGLLAASDYLSAARRYEMSAEFLDLAGKWSGQGRENFQQLARQRKAMRRYEDALLPDTDPAHVVQKLLLNALARREAVAPTGDLIDLPANLRSDIEWLMDMTTAKLHLSLFGKGRSAKGVMDFGTLARFTPQGEGGQGYRIQLDFDSYQSTWYVVRRPQGFRIVGSRFTTGGLAIEAFRMLESGDLQGAKQWLSWFRAEHAGSLSFFDPFAGSPLLRLWTSASPLEPERLRLAAYVALAGAVAEPKVIPGLLQARETATESEQLQIDRALQQAYFFERKHQDLLTHLEGMRARHPKNETLQGAYLLTMIQLKRFAEVEAELENRLKKDPKDALSLSLLHSIAGLRGEIPQAIEQARRAADTAKEDAGLYNQAAWNGLFAETPDRERLRADALRAMELSDSDDAILHTAAAVFAELGEADEALKYLRMAVINRVPIASETHDLWIIGRIAEHYGMPDVARMYYERIPATPEQHLNTYHLAQLRLRRLAAAP